MPHRRPQHHSSPLAPSIRPAVRPVRQLITRRLVQLLGAFLVLAVLAPVSTPAQAKAVPLSGTAKSAALQILTELINKTSATDPRYLEDNVWIDQTPDCFRCSMGPSVLAAARGQDSPVNLYLLGISTSTMDKAIAGHQRADGAFVPPGSGEGNPSIQTVLFTAELASTYLIQKTRLDTATRQRWSDSLTRAADYLISTGDTTYYTNGNINLAIAMVMDLTARITGLPRFQAAATTSLDFVISPNQTLFPGSGLVYTSTPSHPDGSDGAAYFTESGRGGNGYDPAYTLLQVDFVSMWFLLTRNETVKRLTNLLYNQLVPRVRTSDWTIDVSGGTRRTAANLRYGFDVSAIGVLALKGGRTDLQPLVQSQTTAVFVQYRDQTRYSGQATSYNFGIELTALYMAVTSTTGW